MNMQAINTNERIALQAAYWVQKALGDEMTDAEHDAMLEWVFSHPQHRAEFLAHLEAWVACDNMPSHVYRQLLRYLQPTRAPRRTQKLTRLLSAAAATAAIFVVAWLTLRAERPEAALYTTGAGEQRSITLEDGSSVQLNTRTHLQWLSNDSERRVVLHQGEAYFDVTPDSRRPFRVVVDQKEIRVLGTQFNVYRKPAGEVTVAVLKGRVQVLGQGISQILGAHEKLIFHGHTQTKLSMAPSDLAWRQGLIFVHGAPLPELLTEFGRYSARPIVIQNPTALAQLKLTGTYRTRNVEDIIVGLDKILPVTVTSRDGTIVVSARDEKSPRK